MEAQIRETFLRAWRDVMEAKMREDPPDYDWIVRSYVEIRDKLARLTREGSSARAAIDEKMDVALFDQMVRHNAFHGPEFLALVNFTFNMCQALGAPEDDAATQEHKNTVMAALSSGAVFAKLIPLYFEHANRSIDVIYDRIRAIT